MKQVSRDIDPSGAQDLLERVPRACLTFAGGDDSQVLPVGVLWRDGRYLVCMDKEDVSQPISGQEAVLLIDEGLFYFELRAIYIRGQVQLTVPPPGAQDERTWYELFPRKIVAWDYGTLHEVEDEHR